MLHEPRQEQYQYHVSKLARETQRSTEITNETPDIQMRRSHSLSYFLAGRRKHQKSCQQNMSAMPSWPRNKRILHLFQEIGIFQSYSYKQKHLNEVQAIICLVVYNTPCIMCHVTQQSEIINTTAHFKKDWYVQIHRKWWSGMQMLAFGFIMLWTYKKTRSVGKTSPLNYP